jgi:hypothetical protein
MLCGFHQVFYRILAPTILALKSSQFLSYVQQPFRADVLRDEFAARVFFRLNLRKGMAVKIS